MTQELWITATSGLTLDTLEMAPRAQIASTRYKGQKSLETALG